MKKLFSWSTKQLRVGREIRIRLDENGVQIPRTQWELYDFEEIGSQPIVPPPPPPPPPPNYTYTYESSKLCIKRNGTVILSAGVNGFPYCCGMAEFGNIYLTGDGVFRTEEGFAKALDKGIKKMLSELTSDESNQCITLVITLKSNQEFMAESFERTGDFVKVKDFVNSNTANPLTLWYSTN